MSEKHNGGSAFPNLVETLQTGDIIRFQPGMTLRDWLAANAPVSVFEAAAACGFPDLFQAMNDEKQRIAVFKAIVAMRFEYADAMLEARK